LSTTFCGAITEGHDSHLSTKMSVAFLMILVISSAVLITGDRYTSMLE